VTEGWEPLAEFLGVAVPEEPFPHLNDSKMFAERVVDGTIHTLEQWRAETPDVTAAATTSSGRSPSGVASPA
jgi:hypothetical protein